MKLKLPPLDPWLEETIRAEVKAGLQPKELLQAASGPLLALLALVTIDVSGILEKKDETTAQTSEEATTNLPDSHPPSPEVLMEPAE